MSYQAFAGEPKDDPSRVAKRLLIELELDDLRERAAHASGVKQVLVSGLLSEARRTLHGPRINQLAAASPLRRARGILRGGPGFLK